MQYVVAYKTIQSNAEAKHNELLLLLFCQPCLWRVLRSKIKLNCNKTISGFKSSSIDKKWMPAALDTDNAGDAFILKRSDEFNDDRSIDLKNILARLGQ